MKLIITLAISLFVSSSYAEDLNGKLTGKPLEITFEKDGESKTYKLASGLNFGSLWGNGKSLDITINSISSKCQNMLGTPTSPLVFKIQTEQGLKVVTVDPSKIGGRLVAYGRCGQVDSNVLTQLHFNIKGDTNDTFDVTDDDKILSFEPAGEDSQLAHDVTSFQ